MAGNKRAGDHQKIIHPQCHEEKYLLDVDTNVLVYSQDADAGTKRDRAIAALDSLWDSGTGRVSVQVLQEFYLNATRKLPTPVSLSTAREVVSAYGEWVRAETTVGTIIRATEIAEMAQISFWDALIVASADQVAAGRIFSEVLNPGQTIAGIKIFNPLLGN